MSGVDIQDLKRVYVHIERLDQLYVDLNKQVYELTKQQLPKEHPMTTAEIQSNSFVAIDVNVDGVAATETVRYDQFVLQLFKAEALRSMKDHAIIGCCTEVGELADCVKVENIYGRAITKEGLTIREAVVEELGDLRFYMQAIANLYQINEQEILQHNATKLSKRYVGLKYSNDAAIARADKSNKGNTE